MKKAEKNKYLSELGKAIKRYRLYCGITQKQLAIASGYDGNNPSATISKIEQGKIDLTITKLEDISDALGTTSINLIREVAWRMR